MYNCRGTLPLQEVSLAKQNLKKAQDYKADKYSNTDYNLASKNFLEAHNFSFNPIKDEKKVLEFAQKSIDNSKIAIDKSLPSYLLDLQAEALNSKNSAIEAGSETLSTEFFEQGNLLFSEADELSNPPKEGPRVDKSIQRYKESIEAFEKARELSLSQGSGILASSSDIETDLNQIEKYSGNDSSKKERIYNLRKQYKESSKSIEDGKLKEGMASLEKIRLESSNLQSEVLLPYAKEKASLANDSIIEAEKKMSSRNFPISAETSDNLAASKESYNSSIDLIGKERFYDSIQQSEESIKLSRSIIADKNLLASSTSKKGKQDRNSTVKKDESNLPNVANEKVENSASDSKEISSNKKDSNKVGNTSGYKKYIVQKKNPPETLWMIAQNKKNLGNKNFWKKIYSANKKTIQDPDKIFPNQVILIPTK